MLSFYPPGPAQVLPKSSAIDVLQEQLLEMCRGLAVDYATMARDAGERQNMHDRPTLSLVELCRMSLLLPPSCAVGALHVDAILSLYGIDRRTMPYHWIASNPRDTACFADRDALSGAPKTPPAGAAADDVPKAMVYELNRRGKFSAMKEALKQSIVALVQEKYNIDGRLDAETLQARTQL